MQGVRRGGRKSTCALVLRKKERKEGETGKATPLLSISPYLVIPGVSSLLHFLVACYEMTPYSATPVPALKHAQSMKRQKKRKPKTNKKKKQRNPLSLSHIRVKLVCHLYKFCSRSVELYDFMCTYIYISKTVQETTGLDDLKG